MTTIQAEGERLLGRRSRMARCVGENSTQRGEAELIEAVRQGDDVAFGALYELHCDDVRRLARRLSRDQHEADDVASEVFCNTLRALRRGAGPDDALGPYLLRSVRNTLIKTRTRTDTAHASPVTHESLDRVDDNDPYPTPGPASVAFGAVSERHRRVLWSVEIEGVPTATVAEIENIGAPAAASLAYRARCSLRRAFIGASIPATVAPDCVPARSLIASYVDGQLGHDKSAVVDDHVAACIDCAAALDGARQLKSGLGSKSPFALLLLGWRSAVAVAERAVTGLLAASPLAALSGTAALALGVGAIVAIEPHLHEPTEMVSSAPIQAAVSAPMIEPDSLDFDTTATAWLRSQASAADADVQNLGVGRTGAEDVSDAVDNVASDPSMDQFDYPIDLPQDWPGVLPVDRPVDPADDPLEPVLDAVDDTIGTVTGTTTDILVAVVDTVDSTSDGATDAVVAAVDTSTDLVDDVLVAVVDVVDDTTQAVTDLDIVDPAVGDVVDGVVDDVLGGVTDQPVTQTVDDVVVGVVDTVDETLDGVLGILTDDADTGGETGRGGGLLGLLGLGG